MLSPQINAPWRNGIYLTASVFRTSLGNTPYLGAKNIAVEKISPAITAIIPEVEVSAKPNQAGTIKALK